MFRTAAIACIAGLSIATLAPHATAGGTTLTTQRIVTGSCTACARHSCTGRHEPSLHC